LRRKWTLQTLRMSRLTTNSFWRFRRVIVRRRMLSFLKRLSNKDKRLSIYTFRASSTNLSRNLSLLCVFIQRFLNCTLLQPWYTRRRASLTEPRAFSKSMLSCQCLTLIDGVKLAICTSRRSITSKQPTAMVEPWSLIRKTSK
jgi:hypothetical protein